MLAAGPGRMCPASALGGSACMRSVAGALATAWVSILPVCGSVTGPPAHGLARGARRIYRTSPQTRSHAVFHNGSRRRAGLVHRGQSQGIQSQEGRQVRTGEGNLKYVRSLVTGCLSSFHRRGTPTTSPTADAAPTSPTTRTTPTRVGERCSTSGTTSQPVSTGVGSGKSLLVREKGLEPSRPKAPGPKPGASTNSATRAVRRPLYRPKSRIAECGDRSCGLYQSTPSAARNRFT